MNTRQFLAELGDTSIIELAIIAIAIVMTIIGIILVV